MRYFDFHTHRVPDDPAVTAMVSAAERPAGVTYWSLERHPWGDLPPWSREELAAADAVGEIGLDRLKGDWGRQAAFLERVLPEVAASGKTVIFHCVRAVPELLALVRPYPGMRKVFHGFRGKPELLAELMRAGFFVTLGSAALSRSDWRMRPEYRTRIGLESDDGAGDIQELYRRLGMEYAADMERNFREIYQI